MEPKAGGTIIWTALLATKPIGKIRAIDSDKPVVFESAPWGNPEGFGQLASLGLDRVIYSFHMNKPYTFTHQGVYNQQTRVNYPGAVHGLWWSKARLLDAMAAAIDFQNEFNLQIPMLDFRGDRSLS